MNAKEQNTTVLGEIMREKAKYFAKILGISDLEFDCSSLWLERFKVRHEISFKRVCGEANSVETNSVEMENWQTKLLKSCKITVWIKFKMPMKQVFLTGLLPDKTLEFKNVSCHGGKLSKDRLTAMVCANMPGSDKLPVLVIGGSKNPRCFKNINPLTTECLVNKEAWMTSSILY